TMEDPDVWWQMAGARDFSRTEIFSYTAHGAPWIYPAGSGYIFYALFSLGGARLLSLLAPLCCAAIAWLLARRGGVLRASIVTLAIPSIAMATMVRANMFTTLLSAAFLTVLWEKRNKWILPPLAMLWANLHPGFIYGLALTALWSIPVAA